MCLYTSDYVHAAYFEKEKMLSIYTFEHLKRIMRCLVGIEAIITSSLACFRPRSHVYGNLRECLYLNTMKIDAFALSHMGI